MKNAGGFLLHRTGSKELNMTNICKHASLDNERLGVDGWITRINPTWTRAFGCEEVHGVFFQHVEDHGGTTDTVVVNLPEATSALNVAMQQAAALKARVALLCNTTTQAEEAASLAAKLLPNHRRVPVEKAESGMWGKGQ
jgi:hypothetical protein